MIHFLLESSAFLLGSAILATLACAQYAGKIELEDSKYFAGVGVVAALTIASAFV